MPFNMKKMIETDMPGWTTQEVSAAKRDAGDAAWKAEPDQSGVDFDELKRKYLPKRAGSSFAADTVPSRDVDAPTSGTVTLQKIRPKNGVDAAFGSKTVVVDRDGRGIVGKQG